MCGISAQRFQSTPPGWEATGDKRGKCGTFYDFNPRLPGGRRRESASARRCNWCYFNPRLPGGRRQSCWKSQWSIRHFNPRLPGGRRPCTEDNPSIRCKFQSTPPGWEATNPRPPHERTFPYFNPRLPGGRRRWWYIITYACDIFQSTPPGWEATFARHTPFFYELYFNPRLPGGRRRTKYTAPEEPEPFQSTPPGWEATSPTNSCANFPLFQSTPPGWEATFLHELVILRVFYFNPRLPGGRRHQIIFNDMFNFVISIHASRVGGDFGHPCQPTITGISIHASRVGGDTSCLRVPKI